MKPDLGEDLGENFGPDDPGKDKNEGNFWPY